jgi:hypothetical protein
VDFLAAPLIEQKHIGKRQKIDERDGLLLALDLETRPAA